MACVCRGNETCLGFSLPDGGVALDLCHHDDAGVEPLVGNYAPLAPDHNSLANPCLIAHLWRSREGGLVSFEELNTSNKCNSDLWSLFLSRSSAEGVVGIPLTSL